MGISNPVHLAFIAIVALLVLGPKRLPDLARSLGSGMREFRESLNAAIHDDDEGSPTVVAPIAAAPSEHQVPPAGDPLVADAEAVAAGPPSVSEPEASQAAAPAAPPAPPNA